jgi:hypothetical protein
MIRVLRLVVCGMLVWTSLAWGQPPSGDDAALIERSRQRALDYTHSLPDFVCSEVIRRYAAPADGLKLGLWAHTDTLTVKLSYSQKTEGHKLELIDGKPTDRKFEEVGGAISKGEFGGILRTVFDPASQAAFDWESWKTVRKHRIAVYQYAVSAANSPYYLRSGNRRAIVGIHGAIEVDSETGEVLRLTYVAYDIPKQLGVQYSTTTVEYDFANVGGRNYLLPVRSETEVHSSEMWARNKMEFREYRKFSSESTVTFGDGK